MTSLTQSPVCLSISAVDSSGAMFAQADLKTFTALGTYAVAAPTAAMATTFRGQNDLMPVSEALLREALANISQEMNVTAVKVGMVPSSGLVRVIGRWLRENPTIPVVVDPVLMHGPGIPSQTPEVVRAIQQELLPRATVITPNRYEAAQLAGMEEVLGREDMEAAARGLFQAYGCPAVVTGGGLDDSLDVLCAVDGISHFTLPTIRHEGVRVVGVGCTYAAAIVAQLARGESLRESIQAAKSYATELLANARQVGGDGSTRPVCHFLAVNSLAQGDGVGISASGEWQV